VGDLFIGAIIPGLLLVVLYIIYLAVVAWLKPDAMPAIPDEDRGHRHELWLCVIQELIPPLTLIVLVLGSIIGGVATPTEAAAVGAIGAMILAISRRRFNLVILREVMQTTTRVSSMVFMILIGAAIFSLVFRGFAGDDLVHELLSSLPGGKYTALFVVMLVMFLLGFVLDFIEIVFVVVPIVGPVLLAMDIDPVWLGILMAINLQTSFLTPPFGFALFYLRGVAPAHITTMDIYRGVVPFILIQLLALLLIVIWPQLATWLPGLLAD
jgi:tripartite ATP-independent transporter DctM subunit